MTVRKRSRSGRRKKTAKGRVGVTRSSAAPRRDRGSSSRKKRSATKRGGVGPASGERRSRAKATTSTSRARRRAATGAGRHGPGTSATNALLAVRPITVRDVMVVVLRRTFSGASAHQVQTRPLNQLGLWDNTTASLLAANINQAFPSLSPRVRMSDLSGTQRLSTLTQLVRSRIL
jgi:hypothetical protein